jgi:glycosyltransferase involved in cell wall biosynthesis
VRAVWSIPVRGERLESSRGDLVRARYLIEALRAEGHEIHVVEDAARAGANITVSAYRGVVRRALPRRLGLILRDLGRCLHARAHGSHVAREAHVHKAEVIFETQVNFAASGALASRLTGLPLVLDDCGLSSEEVVLGAGLPPLARRAHRQLTRAASVVVTVSEELRRMLIEEDGVAPEKLRVVPNGIDPAAFESADRHATRARLGLGDMVVFGFVGSFQPWHQVELLVEAFADVVGELPSHLLLVGDGPGLEPALAAGRCLGVGGDITATGAVPPPAVAALISSFDVGVMPASNDYGNPMKLMEYAAAGLASVAPDLPPIREVIRDGLTGLLFPPGDVRALRAALKRLATDAPLRESLGERARREVAADASWADRARALVSFVTPAPGA